MPTTVVRRTADLADAELSAVRRRLLHGGRVLQSGCVEAVAELSCDWHEGDVR